MTLYDYIESNQPQCEFTVYDKDYDIETYFYEDILTPESDWDKSMAAIAKKLEVTHYYSTVNEDDTKNHFVTVNLSDVIAKNVAENPVFKELFYVNGVDEIMDGIEAIFAGNVSERWLMDFADSLISLISDNSKQEDHADAYDYDEWMSDYHDRDEWDDYWDAAARSVGAVR
jgi:hypothetical protein